MSNKPKPAKKTIVDSVKSYAEAREIMLVIARAVAEKWTESVNLFEANAQSTFPPPGSIGIILLPPVTEPAEEARGGKDDNDHKM